MDGPQVGIFSHSISLIIFIKTASSNTVFFTNSMISIIDREQGLKLLVLLDVCLK